MSKIRAKFKVVSKLPNQYGTGGRLVLTPVYSTDPESENKKFWDATPNGLLDMHITNQVAFDGFELQKDYYLDFTPVAEAEETADPFKYSNHQKNGA